MQLLSKEQYIQSQQITTRHFRRLKSEGKIHVISGDYVIPKGFELAGMPEKDKEIFLKSKIGTN